jgi:serine/threonine kinase PknH
LKVKIPEMFGAYRRLYPLGKGAMGETFVASKRENGVEERVAVKVCYPSVTRKLKAATTMSNKDIDPRIVRYIEIEPGIDYECHAVSHFFKIKASYRDTFEELMLEEIVAFYIEVCEALVALHGAGIIHGNLKPENIQVHRQKSHYRPMIVDVGLRYVYDESYFSPTILRTILPYMAPELGEAFVQGDPKMPLTLTENGDVYSVMASFCHSLTGQAPFLLDDEECPKEIFEAQKKRSYRFIVKNDPSSVLDIQKLNKILGDSLSPDSGARPQSMSELLSALRETVPQVVGQGS